VPLEPASLALPPLEVLRTVEAAAFRAGGGDYSLPACTLSGFLNGDAGELPAHSCRRARPADLRGFLPEPVAGALHDCLPQMLRKLGRLRPDEVVLYGAETRSTSPLRITRGEDGQSVSLSGLFPAGEGAGYAGGIVSSAVDGVRQAQRLLDAAKRVRRS